MGDALMATAQVKRMYERNKVPVVCLDAMRRPYWSEVFDYNPKITRSVTGHVQPLLNGSGARPYIVGKTAERWTWRPFGPEPGELFLTAQERQFAAPFRGHVMIEPNVKAIGHHNKAWFRDRWQALVDLNIAPMLQCGPVGTPYLRGVRTVTTPTFRLACAVMSVSKAFVGPEGGLHHAAAALGVPAVVLWSHFIAPEITGYKVQLNIRHADGWCGSRVNCQTCAESMAAIEVDEVAENLREALDVTMLLRATQ